MRIELDKIPHAFAKDSVIGKNEKSSIWEKEIRIGFGDKKKLQLYTELAMLLSSGLDIKTALELSVEGLKNKSDKKLLSEIASQVINGKTVSEAFHLSGKFSEYEYFSIKIGEESGSLVPILNDLSSFYKKRIEQKRKALSAFSYPIIVLITAIGTVVFMLRFIVPMFEDVFKRFGSELPPLTQLIISFSNTVKDYGIWVLLLLLLLTAFIFINRKKIWMRKYLAHTLIAIPFLGNLVQKTYLARFCNAMALLIKTKNPLLHSLQLARKMTSFYTLEVALEKVEQDVLYGKSLHASMKAFPLFDAKMISLIKVAEEVNRLDDIFFQLNKQYSEEVEHKTQVFGSLVEPILIVFIGVFIAIILVGMYLPLFQLSTGI